MKKFEIHVADDVLDDLRMRLERTRWPDQVVDAKWDYGTELAYLQELVAYWRDEYDWRAEERALNELPQFIARVVGLDIHFVHVRGKGSDPLPLVVTHGWPSSFCEMTGIIDRLTDPVQFGGSADDAFDVVVPSLPGFAFSEIPSRRGAVRIDRLWRELMVDVLGYARFAAHGSDVGARVTSALGRFQSDVVVGIHIGSVDLEWPSPLPADDELSEAERDYLARVRHWEKTEGGYAEIQSTRPQTLGYGLNDSPAGLASWIVEKFRVWSDCGGEIERCFTKDQLLTNIMIYWVTGTINSSVRRYYEARNNPAFEPLKPGEKIAAPAGIAMFPGEHELIVPREFAERCYDIRQWRDMPRGGHFPAIEEPDLLVDDIRSFFRPMRKG